METLEIPPNRLPDKLSQFARVMLECDVPEGDPARPPLSHFLRHVWLSSGFPDPGSREPEHEIAFVFWYLERFCAKWLPYMWPLPPALLKWLNEPIPEKSGQSPLSPVSQGEGTCGGQERLSRFMRRTWEAHGQQYRIDSAQGLIDFAAWFAVGYLPRQNLSPLLLPGNMVQLLNRPAAGETLPITVGMLSWSRQNGHGFDVLPEEIAGTRAIEFCFQSLRMFAATSDCRLIPAFVSKAWRAPAPRDDLSTVFDSIASKFAVGTPAPRGRNSDDSAPLLRLFEGAPRSLTPAAHEPILRPADRLVVSYRDRKTVCGLGISGAYVVAALRRSGVDLVDLDYSLPRDRNRQEWLYNRWNFSGGRKKLHLFNINPESVPFCLANHSSRIGSEDYLIGSFFWELSDTSQIHDEGLALVDEVWAASEFLVELYRRRTNAPIINMGHTMDPGSPDLTLSRRHFGLPERNILFLVNFDAGSIIERKNPLGAVIAFEAAFPRGDEAAGLVIKTRNTKNLATKRDWQHWRKVLERAASDPRIRILEDTFPRGAMAALYCLTDCFVSLHRSEGFGQGTAEAMFYGKPVIVTAYSGVLDFCTPETARLVSYRLATVDRSEYPYIDEDRHYEWAEPNLGDAVDHMREVFEDRRPISPLALNGQRMVRSMFGVEATRKRYARRLKELGFLSE